jgi:hypothetical protein
MADFGAGASGAVSGAAAGSALGPWGAAIGGAVGGLAGLFGGGGANQRRAVQAQKDALKYLQGINPEAVDAWANAQENTQGRDAQVGYLRQFQEMGDQKGMDLQSRVAQRQAMDASNQAERSQREAVLSNAAQRGTLGSGQELAAQLVAQQGNANRTSSATADFASQARQRALQAMQYGNQTAGNIRQGDASFQQSKLGAANAISSFNAQQRLNKGQLVGNAYSNLSNAYANRGAQQLQQGAGIGQMAGAALGYGAQALGYGQPAKPFVDNSGPAQAGQPGDGNLVMPQPEAKPYEWAPPKF